MMVISRHQQLPGVFMAKQILVVVTNPVPGKEGEYNRWYNEQHLNDVLRVVPGMVAAQRFELAYDAAKSLPGRYLAIYEMETDDADPKAPLIALGKATEAGQAPVSPALDGVNIVASVFKPITDRRLAPGSKPANGSK
jgi:hypothetical protein